MKNKLVGIFAVLLMCSLTACGEKEIVIDDSNYTQLTSEIVTDTPVEIVIENTNEDVITTVKDTRTSEEILTEKINKHAENYNYTLIEATYFGDYALAIFQDNNSECKYMWQFETTKGVTYVDPVCTISNLAYCGTVYVNDTAMLCVIPEFVSDRINKAFYYSFENGVFNILNKDSESVYAVAVETNTGYVPMIKYEYDTAVSYYPVKITEEGKLGVFECIELSVDALKTADVSNLVTSYDNIVAVKSRTNGFIHVVYADDYTVSYKVENGEITEKLDFADCLKYSLVDYGAYSEEMPLL